MGTPNKQAILSKLNMPHTVSECAEAVGVTYQTSKKIFDVLLREQLIKPTGTMRYSDGRPAALYQSVLSHSPIQARKIIHNRFDFSSLKMSAWMRQIAKPDSRLSQLSSDLTDVMSYVIMSKYDSTKGYNLQAVLDTLADLQAYTDAISDFIEQIMESPVLSHKASINEVLHTEATSVQEQIEAKGKFFANKIKDRRGN